MLTSTDIIKRDGWTRTAIAKFLPHPDATDTWRYAGHGSGLRYFYDDDRVLTVESSAGFETWKEQRAARIVADKKPASLPPAAVDEALEFIEWVVTQTIGTESAAPNSQMAQERRPGMVAGYPEATLSSAGLQTRIPGSGPLL
jgi:hypothetical protein